MDVKKLIFMAVIPLLVLLFMNQNHATVERNIPNIQEAFADQEVTELGVRNALRDVPVSSETIQLDRIKQMEVELNRETDAILDKTIQLYFDAQSITEPEALMQTVAATTATAMQILFANDNITKIVLTVEDQTMNTPENDHSDPLIRISMNENSVKRGEWEALKQEIIKDYRVLFQRADEVFMIEKINKAVSS